MSALHCKGYIAARVKCELRNCEWVFCELKCEPARDWSAICRTTRSLPGANAITHNRNFRTGNKTCILAHTTRVYAMHATITVCGAKFFGSALLQLVRSVCVSLSAFSLPLRRGHNNIVIIKLVT